MDLSEIETKFIRAQEAAGLSHYTIRNYRATFRDLRRFAETRGLTLDTQSLTNDLIRDFQLWLRSTPLMKPRHGSTRTSPSRTLTRLHDVEPSNQSTP